MTYNEWEPLASRSSVALGLHTLRTASHELTVELGSGAGKLYELLNDPHARDNLFDD